MRKLVLGSFVVALVAMSLPSSQAFHGCPYTGNGTAVRDDGTLKRPVLLATVHWGGQNWCPTFDGDFTTGDEMTFSVVLSDSDGTTVVSSTFSGEEDIPASIVECDEVVAPYFGWSTDPAVSFDIAGYQDNSLCTGDGHMTYEGTFGLSGGATYRLAVVVERFTT